MEIIWRLVSRYLCNVSQSLYVEVCAAVEKGDRPEISKNIFQNFNEKSIENNLLVGKGIFGEGRIAQIALKDNLPEYIIENKSKLTIKITKLGHADYFLLLT
mgnify:CR=1 FL=1